MASITPNAKCCVLRMNSLPWLALIAAWTTAALLRLHRSLRVNITRIDRRAAADIKPIAAHSAESQVGYGLRQMNLAEQDAVRPITPHAIFLRIRPAHAAPDISLDVATHSVG